MKRKRRLREWIVLMGFVFSMMCGPLILDVAHAAAAGQVVINEIAWAGSADSSSDEWIELYNNSDQAADLTGWRIDSAHAGSSWKILSGTVAAHGYFLIERRESAVSNVTADAVISISLVNSGDCLKLYDASGDLIDTVNGSGGAWYAGSDKTYASMERIDPLVTTDSAANWATSTGGSGATASAGMAILGTPGGVNSKFDGTGGSSGGSGSGGSGGSGSGQTASVDLVPSVSTLQNGQELTLTAHVTNAQNLFSYGFEITYDPAVLQYEGSSEQPFLGENAAVATSFQADLQNGQAGTLLVAGARTVQSKSGITGSGDLFTVQFDVLAGTATTVRADGGSFLASPSGDLAAQFHALSLNAQVAQPAAVNNLAAGPGPQRYSIALSWDAVAGAQNYHVYRKDAHGQFQLIGETNNTYFTDADGVAHGGFIVPAVNYVYEVAAVLQNVEGVPAQTVGAENRGFKGDNNRSDRVDGRDLQNLANHFGETDADQNFDPLADTTYDGRIDGSDLIDLGANFARLYQG